MKPLLIIKTGCTVSSVPSAWGDFEHWIAAGAGLELAQCRVCKVMEDETLPPPRDISGVVITGSPAMVSERLPWSEYTAQWLRDAARRELVPILGICYGHQLLAHALGGSVDFHPQGREMGTVEVGLTPAASDDALFDAIPELFPAQVSHMQSVLRLPEECTVLAGNSHDRYQGVRYAPGVWGVQFHPEFSPAVMHAYIDAREEVLVKEEWHLGRLRAAVRETADAARVLSNFGKLL